jgi:hypothetical protein
MTHQYAYLLVASMVKKLGIAVQPGIQKIFIREY